MTLSYRVPPPETQQRVWTTYLVVSMLVVQCAAGSFPLPPKDTCPSEEQQALWDPSNKALLAPIVFQGKLLSKWHDEARNLLVKLRVQKVLKRLPSAGVPFYRKEEVVVALVRHGAMGAVRNRYGTQTRSPSLRTRRRRRAPCPVPLSAEASLLVTNGRYLVYAAPLQGAWAAKVLPLANMSATALPDPFTKKSSRSIRRVVCRKCVLKPAAARGLRSMKIEMNKRLRMQCKLNGNPIPWVQWYFNGKRIVPNQRVRITTRRRRSQLEIRVVRPTDSGMYECRGANVLRREWSVSRGNVTVKSVYFPRYNTTLNRPTTPDTQHPTIPPYAMDGRRCDQLPHLKRFAEDYCLNSGKCIYYETLQEPACQCADGFFGHRCEQKVATMVKSEYAPPEYDAAIRMMHTNFWARR